MHYIHTMDWEYLKQQSFLWNDYDSPISMEERDLAVLTYGDTVVLPKFLLDNYRDYFEVTEFGEKLLAKPELSKNFKKTNLHVSKSPRPEQEIVFATIIGLYEANGRVNGIIQAKPGVGKEQPYSEPVLTPDGWTTMGKLKVNDYVVDASGNPTKVLQIHEQGIKDVYEIEFNDGTKVRCGLEHLWKVHDRSKNKYFVKTLKEILVDYLRKPNKTKYGTIQKRPRYAIDLCSPINFNKTEDLALDSYIMGLLLGDGGFTIPSVISFSDKNGNNIKEIVEYCTSRFSDFYYYCNNEEHGYYYLKSKQLIEILNNFNLMGKKSIEKHIPQEYLFSSIENRKKLLNGILNTDSYKLNNKNSKEQQSYQLYSSSPQMINDYYNLVLSLGIFTNPISTKEEPKFTYRGETRTGQPSHSITINFNKSRKTILNITKLDYQENSRCITVDNKDHLYITTGYTVTHNTYMSIKLASMLKLQAICVVPNDILEDQWKEAIIGFTGISEDDIGIIQGSDIEHLKKKGTFEKPIMIAKVQSLLAQLKVHSLETLRDLYKEVGIVFYDECHVSGSALSYSKTTSMFHTDNIIGLSATPFLKGLNSFLMHNSMGEVLIDLDHQNLIPHYQIFNYPVEFTPQEISRLRFIASTGDYIQFLAVHNMYLESKDNYLNYLADWVVYMNSINHISAILFSTNKLVVKFAEILKQRGLDPGIITGSTRKKKKKEFEYLNVDGIGLYNYCLPLVFPKRKEHKQLIPKKGFITISNKVKEDIIKINKYLVTNNYNPIEVHVSLAEELSEREIMATKRQTVSNFKMLTAGYSREELSHIIIGTPLVGAIPSIQVSGRITRANEEKNQNVQAQFFFSSLFTELFPDKRFNLKNNIKKGYPTATFQYEGFNDN